MSPRLKARVSLCSLFFSAWASVRVARPYFFPSFFDGRQFALGSRGSYLRIHFARVHFVRIRASLLWLPMVALAAILLGIVTRERDSSVNRHSWWVPADVSELHGLLRGLQCFIIQNIAAPARLEVLV